MKKLKNIHIGFENCEVIEIPVASIDHLSLSNIADSIQFINHQKYYCERKIANSINISIYKNGIFNDVTDWSKENKIERLSKFNDIVCIDLNYEDGETKQYYVPWGEGEYNNEYQKSEYKKNYWYEDVLEINICKPNS